MSVYTRKFIYGTDPSELMRKQIESIRRMAPGGTFVRKLPLTESEPFDFTRDRTGKHRPEPDKRRSRSENG